VSLFQFLMVRLKESCVADRSGCYSISIPYGAIKSYKGRKSNICTFISIPYGAIKRRFGKFDI